MSEITKDLLSLAEELGLPPEVLPSLEAAKNIPWADIPLAALDELLPESSGIRRFAGDYDRLLVREDNTEFYRWLFRKPGPVPAEDLPEDTGLQRAAKARLAAGGKIGMARGALNRRELFKF